MNLTVGLIQKITHWWNLSKNACTLVSSSHPLYIDNDQLMVQYQFFPEFIPMT
jgi:hypothetical protein